MHEATEPMFPLQSEMPAHKPQAPVQGPKRYWMPLALLVAAGWGALFSFALIYLSDDAPLRPTSALTRKGDFPGSLPPDPTEIMRVVASEVPPAGPPKVAAPGEGTLAATPGTQALIPPVPPVAKAPDPADAVVTGAPPPLATPAEHPVVAAAEPAEPVKPEFVGIWGPTKQACGTRAKRLGLLQATISTERAKAGKTTCNFRNLRKNGNAWVMAAECNDGAQRWASQVRLLVDEDRLTWTSGKGLANYVRCGRRTG